jgi:hypothetical protein
MLLKQLLCTINAAHSVSGEALCLGPLRPFQTRSRRCKRRITPADNNLSYNPFDGRVDSVTMDAAAHALMPQVQVPTAVDIDGSEVTCASPSALRYPAVCRTRHQLFRCSECWTKAQPIFQQVCVVVGPRDV